MSHRIGRLAVVISAIAALLALSASAALASGELLAMTEIYTANDDMNSTAVETSGATYNGHSHVLLTIDDEQNAYEFQLNPDGTINHWATPRVIDLALGANDFEGVAWISGETYGFLSEGAGQVIIATMPPASANGTTQIDTGDIERSFPVIWGTWGNLGPEGLAYDGSDFFVTREMPATLTKFNFAGNFIASVSLNEIADASGVATLEDGTYLVTSHESRSVSRYEIDWDTETAVQLETRDTDLFTQLEGIAVMDGTDVHLFGEDNTRKGQPGQTYSHLNGQLVPTRYSVSDLNCSGHVNITDALIISQYRSGLVELNPGCGTGDHNNDGKTDLLDAIMIGQCQIGIANVGCPDIGIE